MQKGSKQTEEAKRKMSETRKGRPLSEAHKAALSKSRQERDAKRKQKGTEHGTQS